MKLRLMNFFIADWKEIIEEIAFDILQMSLF